MRLTYLKIQHFGKLKEKEFFPKEGINVVYGPNESGKSTLHAFIRGMLFGMPRYRGRASKTDPYTKYEPWERPVDYAGVMGFQAGGKEFRVERNFYKGDIRENLICETDGEELSIPQGDLRMLLGGISESIYDNTVSIGQLRSETDEGMVRELQNYMSNYESAGAGDLDVQRAGERLKKKKKQWENKIRELELGQAQQMEEMEKRMEYLRKEQEGLENQLDQVRAEIERQQNTSVWEKEEAGHLPKAVQENEKKEPVRQAEAKDKTGRGGWMLTVSGMLFGALFLLLAIGNPFAFTGMVRIAVGVCGGLGMALAVVGSWRMFRTMSRRAHQERPERTGEAEQESAGERNTESERNIEREKSRDREEYVNRLKGREETLLQQMEEKHTLLQNLQENRAEKGEKPQEIRNCEIEIQSLDLAMEMLEKLSGGMRRRIGRRLQGRMEEILAEITEGKYGRILMDEDMRVSLYEGNRQTALHQLSRGTVEQVYFALRMAVSEVLCEEPMPVLLDDVFAMYDEKRLEQTLGWLAARGGQVLIFTCHKREMELLRRMKIPANIIELEETPC
ncbi:MAG: AAA family ATPase [Clostridiales bacterium]|nr:AAA family ATPase [Clostridiales bacterium]